MMGRPPLGMSKRERCEMCGELHPVEEFPAPEVHFDPELGGDIEGPLLCEECLDIEDYEVPLDHEGP